MRRRCLRREHSRAEVDREGRAWIAVVAILLLAGVHVGPRGYIRCTVDAAQLHADLRVVSTVRAPTATVTNRASFLIQHGIPGVHVA
jgi:alkaline phosphatase D